VFFYPFWEEYGIRIKNLGLRVTSRLHELKLVAMGVHRESMTDCHDLLPRPLGHVEKVVSKRTGFVETGLVELAKSRPWRGHCPNFIADSHPANGGIPTATSPC